MVLGTCLTEDTISFVFFLRCEKERALTINAEYGANSSEGDSEYTAVADLEVRDAVFLYSR